MMVSNMNSELTVAAFIAGYAELYTNIVERKLYHVPISQLDITRNQLKSLGYKPRIRYRGPRIGTDNRHTLKRHAVAFTVYLD